MFQAHYCSDEYMIFIDQELLPSGQTTYIEIAREKTNKIYYYSIYFVIANKRKTIDNSMFHITGKDGLLGLIWARNKLIEFEQYIQERYFDKSKKHILYCRWTDNRRRNAYERGLKPLGFSYMRIFNQKALGKVIFQP